MGHVARGKKMDKEVEDYCGNGWECSSHNKEIYNTS